MASPMRERRAWPPDRDSEGETAAAFEAAVAEIKKRVVSSGEVLNSAKEDLNDHQRWLKAQAVAAQADRERLGRLLHRQRQAQEAVARRERKRAWRRAKLQAAARSVNNAILAVVLGVVSAVWRSAAAIVAGLNTFDAMAMSGLRWTGVRLREGLGFAWRMLVRAATWAQRTLRASVLFTLPRLASGARRFGALLAMSAARVGPRVQVVAPIVRDFLVHCRDFLSRWFGVLAASTRRVSDRLGLWLEAHFPALRVKARDAGRALGVRLAPVWSSVAARIHTLAPNLSRRIAEVGTVAGTYLRGKVPYVATLLTRPKTDVEDRKNAVSLRARNLDRSQMLIFAGAILLICGALMVGGGLLFRTGKPSAAASTPVSEPIAWLFEHDSLTRDERSVFAFAATPEGVRIKGFAIGGVNLSDHALDQVESVIKPDHQAKDIRLAMRVAAPEDPANEIKAFEPGTLGAIPPQGQFALLFSFPEENGLTPEQVLSTFGGVMLKVHYSVGGEERSFIHYLSPALLERQLAEITGAANGS